MSKQPNSPTAPTEPIIPTDAERAPPPTSPSEGPRFGQTPPERVSRFHRPAVWYHEADGKPPRAALVHGGTPASADLLLFDEQHDAWRIVRGVAGEGDQTVSYPCWSMDYELDF